MSKIIDCGFLNEKCLNRTLKEVRNSDLDIIEVHVLKVKENISVVLEFRDEKEKERWNKHSGNLVKDLKKLWR